MNVNSNIKVERFSGLVSENDSFEELENFLNYITRKGHTIIKIDTGYASNVYGVRGTSTQIRVYHTVIYQ